MNQFLAVLSGGIIAISVMMNGQLSESYGSPFSTVFIHLSGAVASLLLVFLQRSIKLLAHSYLP